MNKSTILKSALIASVVSLSSFALLASPTPAGAWKIADHAGSACVEEKAVIDWYFKNTEPKGDKWSMEVTVSDEQTGETVTKTVAPGKHIKGTFSNNSTKLDGGTVVFDLTWTNGRNGVDQFTNTYPATPECYTPEQPAFNANVVCGLVDEKAVFTLRVNQTAGDVEGVFTPANGDTVVNGDELEVLGMFNTENTSEKIVVKTASVADCTPEVVEKEVCRDGEIITINENDKLSTDTDVCPVVEEPEVLATVTELPKTGPGVAVAGLIGSVFAAGTAASHALQRRR